MSPEPFSARPRQATDTIEQQAPLSVSQLNQRARNLLERQFSRAVVAGEVSNHKVVSGHVYFTLKDSQSQLACVLFRREASQLKFQLKPGMEVIATGRLTIYGPYGRYQLVCERLEPLGAGALQAAYEQLKGKLNSEGLFDPAKKRELPRLPRRVAVVTSPTGAVIRDIVHVAKRRFPNCQIIVAPTRVQGGESAPDIVRALAQVGRSAETLGIDVVIVGRGGGSIEDLWGFNDEAVARAIAACPIPVVSAVGHETDFTIADFVADCRAPTPSAAAELVYPIRSELAASLDRPVERAFRALRRGIENRRYRLNAAAAGMVDGRMLLRQYAQRLSEAQLVLAQLVERRVGTYRLRLTEIQKRLMGCHPRTQMAQNRARLEHVSVRLHGVVERMLVLCRSRLSLAGGKLDALSPLGVLGRGYAIVFGADKTVIRDPKAVSVGDSINVRIAGGRLQATVDSTEEKT